MDRNPNETQHFTSFYMPRKDGSLGGTSFRIVGQPEVPKDDSSQNIEVEQDIFSGLPKQSLSLLKISWQKKAQEFCKLAGDWVFRSELASVAPPNLIREIPRTIK